MDIGNHAHDNNAWAQRFAPLTWRDPQPDMEPYGYPFRTCSYCGSIHPLDLLAFLDKGGVRLNPSDRKWGWPHKLYLDGIPNPMAGKVVRMGGRSWTDEAGVRQEEPFMEPAPAFTHAKFYNVHLMDMPVADFLRLAELIEQETGVVFSRPEDEPHSLYWQG